MSVTRHVRPKPPFPCRYLISLSVIHAYVHISIYAIHRSREATRKVTTLRSQWKQSSQFLQLMLSTTSSTAEVTTATTAEVSAPSAGHNTPSTRTVTCTSSLPPFRLHIHQRDHNQVEHGQSRRRNLQKRLSSVKNVVRFMQSRNEFFVAVFLRELSGE